MLATSIGDFNAKLNTFLMERLDLKRPPCVVADMVKIRNARSRQQKCVLYFVWDVRAFTLVIRVIQFQPQRSGHGSALLRFLADQAESFGYRFIAIESTGDNGAEFAQRFGFKNESHQNWLIPVETLRMNLDLPKCAIERHEMLDWDEEFDRLISGFGIHPSI